MIQPVQGSTTARTSPWIAISVAVGFAVFYLLLRTRQYTDVDGALRCLAVFYNPVEQFHGSNHMLYPFWMWAWTRLAAVVGLNASGWLAFLRQCQALNSVCAAAGVGMLFTVLETIAGARFALLGSLQYGLTTAVLLHATNSAEPVTGLFFALSALAVLVLALRTGNRAGLFLVGVLLALALASYQAMGLIAPLVAFACVCWPPRRWKLAATRLTLVGLGGALSVIAVYGHAYAVQGIPPRQMPKAFFTIVSDQIYGGFNPSKLVNLPMGLIANLFNAVPDPYAGIRSLLRGPHAAFWVLIALAGFALLAPIVWLVASGLVQAVRQSGIPAAFAWLGIFVSALAVAFPLFYWAPLYNKLWLLPLAVLTIAAAFAFRLSASQPGRQKMLAATLVALLATEAAVNIPRAVRDHLQETAHLDQASDVEGLLTSQDRVVVDFDDVSVLWFTIWSHERAALVLPASTGDQVAKFLSQAPGDSLVFLGVLDHDPAVWDQFIGQPTGLPYAAFRCYRERSVVLRRFQYGTGFVSVRRLSPASSCGLATTGTGPAVSPAPPGK